MKRPELPPWVPDDQRDTAYWIFFENYLCRIPYIQMVSVEYLEQFGMPYSGSKAHDYGTVNELRTISIPIHRIAEYFEGGARISLAKRDDAKRVYQRITDHLNAWKNRIGVSLNPIQVPWEDLKLLDRLANSVYEYAKYQFTDEIIDDILSKMRSKSSLDLDSFVNSFKIPQPTEERKPIIDSTPKYPARQSMADFFNPKPYQGLNQKSNSQPTAQNGGGGGLKRGGGIMPLNIADLLHGKK